MVKRVIKETVSKYDKDGNLVIVTTTETAEDVDSQFTWNVPLVTCQTDVEADNAGN